MKRRMMILFTLVLAAVLSMAPQSMAATPRKLMIAIGQEPSSMDQSLVWVGAADYQLSMNYGEYLIDRAPNGDLKPGLATSWKISPDGKVIEFTLRRGVKFHSGDLLTTKDVAFSFDRWKAKNLSLKTRLDLIDRVEIIDDYHFKIHFKRLDVTYIPKQGGGMIVSKAYYDRVGENEFVKKPVGTGPFKVVSYVPGEYADIERFEDYWGQKPSVKEARFFFVPEDATRLAKLKAGEVDLITTCPYSAAKDIESSPGLKLVKLATNHPTVSVIMQIQNPNVPWHDTRVRLAMAHAIDWKSIVDHILMGIPNHWDFLAPYELGYDPDLKSYPYNPKSAKELLAEAGYAKGFDLKLYYPIIGIVPMHREVSEAIASYFEAVGIRTKLIAEEWLSYRKRHEAAKLPDADFVAVHTHGRAGMVEPSYALDLFWSKNGGNSIYYLPELDKIITEARATVNDAKRGELIKKAIKIIHDEVLSIPVYNNVAIYAMKKSIDFTPTQKYNMDLLMVRDIIMK